MAEFDLKSIPGIIIMFLIVIFFLFTFATFLSTLQSQQGGTETASVINESLSGVSVGVPEQLGHAHIVTSSEIVYNVSGPAGEALVPTINLSVGAESVRFNTTLNITSGSLGQICWMVQANDTAGNHLCQLFLFRFCLQRQMQRL